MGINGDRFAVSEAEIVDGHWMGVDPVEVWRQLDPVDGDKQKIFEDKDEKGNKLPDPTLEEIEERIPDLESYASKYADAWRQIKMERMSPANRPPKRPHPEDKRDFPDDDMSSAGVLEADAYARAIEAGLFDGERVVPLDDPALRVPFRYLVGYHLYHQKQIDGVEAHDRRHLEQAVGSALQAIETHIWDRRDEKALKRFVDYREGDGRKAVDAIAGQAWESYLEAFGLAGKAKAEKEAAGKKEREFKDKLGDEYDFGEVLKLRFQDDGGLTDGMRRAADDWLDKTRLSQDEGRKLRDRLVKERDDWSDKELKALLDSRVLTDPDQGRRSETPLSHKYLARFAVEGILYDRTLPDSQEYENALNGLAVWLKEMMGYDTGKREYLDQEAKEYLRTVVRYQLQDLKSGDKDQIKTLYRDGVEEVMKKLPKLIAARVQNAYRDDDVPEMRRKEGSARKAIEKALKDGSSNWTMAVNSQVVIEHDDYKNWAAALHPDAI